MLWRGGAEAPLMLTTSAAATTVGRPSPPLSHQVFGLFKGLLLGINHFHHNLQDDVFVHDSRSFLGNGVLVEEGWLAFHHGCSLLIAERNQTARRFIWRRNQLVPFPASNFRQKTSALTEADAHDMKCICFNRFLPVKTSWYKWFLPFVPTCTNGNTFLIQSIFDV